ncbi:MAG: acetyltransferase, partial [Clostridia bacterium]|nr:acetyltransferase [Clostridia bacterium]
MSKEVVIIGAGGHGRVVADIVKACGDYVLGFLDDAAIENMPMLGKVKDCEKYSDKEFIIAIGNNSIRRSIAEKYPRLNYYSAIHPSAVIGSDVTIGKGTCVMPLAVINNAATIGKHSIINTHATIEHDCAIGDFVHISPSATLCGTVCVDNNTQIGAGSVVRNNTTIADDVMIGAGSVVVKDITVSGTYIGV